MLSVEDLAKSQANEGFRMLANFAGKMLGKRQAITITELLRYEVFCQKVLELLPSADPSWGVLRQAASRLLKGLLLQGGTLEEISLAQSWDERILADQLATLLFHLRKLLRSPYEFNRAPASLEALGKPPGTLHAFLKMYDDEVFEESQSSSQETHIVPCSRAENKAVLAIEDKLEEAPELKWRYHQRLKKEKKEKEARLQRVKKIDEELAYLQGCLGLKVGLATPRKRARTSYLDHASARKSKRRTGRRYLPHSELGELQLTLATKKSYICFKSVACEGPLYRHLVTVSSDGKLACERHQDVCEELFRKVSEGNLCLDEATKLRSSLIQASKSS